MNIVEKLPLPASGLILALFSLGNLLQDIHPSLRYLWGAVGAVFLILILLLFILYLHKKLSNYRNMDTKTVSKNDIYVNKRIENVSEEINVGVENPKVEPINMDELVKLNKSK